MADLFRFRVIFRYFYRKHRNMQTYYISRNGLKNYQRNNRPLTGDGVQEFAPAIGVGMLDSTICDTENFLALKETLKRMTQQELSLGTSYGSDYVQQLSGITDISKKIAAIRDGNGVNTGVTVGDIEINIPIEHVNDYNDFVSQLQKDKQFERFVQSMTVDRLVGGGSLKKNKYFGNK